MFPGGLGLRIGVQGSNPLDEEGEPKLKGTLSEDQHLQKIEFGENVHQSFVYFIMKGATVKGIRKIVVDTPKTEGAFEGAKNEVVIYHELKKHGNWRQYVLPFKHSEKGSKTIILDFDYIAGKDLLEFIKKDHPSRAKLENLLSQAKEALAFSHKHNVLHGDIKPDNFYVSEDGEHCYLFDFGSGVMEDDIDPDAFTYEMKEMDRMIQKLLPYAKGGGRRHRTRRARRAKRTTRRTSK